MEHEPSSHNSFSKTIAPSGSHQVDVASEDAHFCEHVAVPESLKAALAAPVCGSSLSQDLQHLNRLIDLRIYEDNDEIASRWLDKEIEDRILMIRSYDIEDVAAEMSKQEASKEIEKIQSERNVLRCNVPEGSDKGVDRVVAQIDEFLTYMEESWIKDFWAEAKKKLEGLGR